MRCFKFSFCTKSEICLSLDKLHCKSLQPQVADGYTLVSIVLKCAFVLQFPVQSEEMSSLTLAAATGTIVRKGNLWKLLKSFKYIQ